MKYALLILVVLLVWWLLRSRSRKPRETRPSRNARSAQAMVYCGHCGVHLPQAEALFFRGSYYCDETHRVASERRE